MFKVLIILLTFCLLTLCIITQQAIGQEKDKDLSLEKKDYKMEKKDYGAQIMMILILVTLAFVLG